MDYRTSGNDGDYDEIRSIAGNPKRVKTPDVRPGEEAGRLSGDTVQRYEPAVKTRPDEYETLSESFEDVIEAERREKAERLFREAVLQYEDELTPFQVDPEMPRPSHSADTEKVRLEAALERDAVPRLVPDVYATLMEQGNAFAALARTKRGKEADKLYRDAFRRYEAALKVRPDASETFCAWADAVVALAKTKRGWRADWLFRGAFQKYELALEAKPDMREALRSWAIGLTALARTKKGKTAAKLFRDAFRKFEEAWQILPDDSETLKNWGYSLAALARTRQGTERDLLLDAAMAKFQAIEAIKKGEGAYDTACLYSMKGNRSQALAWLEAALKAMPMPSRCHIDTDTDLNFIRPTHQFQELMIKYRPN